MPSLRRAQSACFPAKAVAGGDANAAADAEALEAAPEEFFSPAGSPSNTMFELELSQHGGQRTGGVKLHRDDMDAARCSEGSDLQRILALCRPATQLEAQLLADVRKLKPGCVSEAGFDILRLAAGLEAAGWTAALCCNDPHDGSGRPQYGRRCLENLHHTFIQVTGRHDNNSHLDAIVEPRLREQFQIAHPTTGYETLLKAAAQEFVGTPARLRELVELLCAEIAAAFATRGLSLPPWRRARSMLSKWFPNGQLPAAEPTPALDRKVGGALQPALLPAPLPPAPQPQLGTRRSWGVASRRAQVVPAVSDEAELPVEATRRDDTAHRGADSKAAMPAAVPDQAQPRPRARAVPLLESHNAAALYAAPLLAQPAVLSSQSQLQALRAPGGVVSLNASSTAAAQGAGAPRAPALSEDALLSGRKRAVSLLARGLASMAPAVPAAGEATGAVKPAKRSTTWGLPHITTVRRMGAPPPRQGKVQA